MIEITRDEFVYLTKHKLIGSFTILNKGKDAKRKKRLLGGENEYIITWLRNNVRRTKNYRLAPPSYMSTKPQVLRALSMANSGARYTQEA